MTYTRLVNALTTAMFAIEDAWNSKTFQLWAPAVAVVGFFILIFVILSNLVGI